jgi:hypothetical protein
MKGTGADRIPRSDGIVVAVGAAAVAAPAGVG